MNSTLQIGLIALFMFVAVLASVNPVSAATVTWVVGNGAWNNPMNWSPQTVPDADDTAVIDGAGEMIIAVTGHQSIGALILQNPNAILRLGTDQTGSQTFLTVANGFENQGTIELRTRLNNSHVRLTVTTGTLTNAVGGVIRSIENADGANRQLLANLDNRGALLVLTGATLNMNGVFSNGSSGLWGGNGTFDFASATINNEGTVAPGVSPGILTVNGNLPLNAVTRFDVELSGFTAGTEHDQLVLSSPISFNGIIRVGLINGFFPKKDDAFTVLTYPSRTGVFATLDNPLPERIAWEVQYGPTSAQLVVLNTAPTLTTITNQTVSEQTQLSVTASATDQDLPAQTMTYSLETAPPGMTINPSTGQINWTPTEAQGPGGFDVTVRVTDNGTPSLGHTNSFTVTVNEVNVAPQITPPAQTVAEQSELVVTINGTDADLPANTLTYEMLSAPTEATFNPATRELRRTPTEAQGPSNFTATFRVTDHNPAAVNEQQLSVTNSLSIVVNEVNLAPLLVPPADRTIHAGFALSTAATATDQDAPANTFIYAKVSGPEGVNVSATGLITWTTSDADSDTTNVVVLQVTDNGAPSLSATNRFVITVDGPPVFTSIRKGGGVATAVWQAIPGTSYPLLYKTNFADATWSDLAGNVTATGNTASTEDSSADGARFYRLIVLP